MTIFSRDISTGKLSAAKNYPALGVNLLPNYINEADDRFYSVGGTSIKVYARNKENGTLTLLQSANIPNTSTGSFNTYFNKMLGDSFFNVANSGFGRIDLFQIYP